METLQSEISANTPQTANQKSGLDMLITLHTRTVDAISGYAKMVKKAEPELRDTAEAFRALHARQADTLARMLAGRGVPEAPDGSFMGSVNRAVVATRALFDALDRDVLPSMKNGERHILAAFDDAIASNPRSEDQQNLHAMRSQLTRLLKMTGQGI